VWSDLQDIRFGPPGTDSDGDGTLTLTLVPEPSTATLLTLALLGSGLAFRRPS
jgi:hypothetical protein